MTLEEEMIAKAGKEMANEIDREVLWGMLEGMGWHRVMLPRLIDNNHAVDIAHWLALNCKNSHERNGRDFLFESARDADWFVLRWGTT
jgi:hypothetical protein